MLLHRYGKHRPHSGAAGYDDGSDYIGGIAAYTSGGATQEKNWTTAGAVTTIPGDGGLTDIGGMTTELPSQAQLVAYGWDFANTWKMDTNPDSITYNCPVFQWQ